MNCIIIGFFKLVDFSKIKKKYVRGLLNDIDSIHKYFRLYKFVYTNYYKIFHIINSRNN